MSEIDCFWAAIGGGVLGGGITFWVIFLQFRYVMARYMSFSQNFKTWQKVNILEEDVKLILKDIKSIRKDIYEIAND